MAEDVAAFCFETLPEAIFKATLKGPFLQIEARRFDGLLVGGGGLRCEALADDEPRLPPNAAQFIFRTLPNFVFTANLTVREVVTQDQSYEGGGTTKRASHWIDLSYRQPDGTTVVMGGVSMGGPWD